MTTESEINPRILLVDDDAVIAHVYRMKLVEAGYTVDVAEDGLVALRMMNANPPDLVVLDVMMPKFNGLEVLGFIRSRPELAGLKVVVLSNFYFDATDRQVVLTKADCGLVKSNCTPQKLIETVDELLLGNQTKEASPAIVPAATAVSVKPVSAGASGRALPGNPREDFLKNATATMAYLRQLGSAFTTAEDRQAQNVHLLEFYRKVHFVTALAGQAGCARIALLLNAFEALLLELHEKPVHINASTLQTTAFTLDFLAVLFAHADKDAAGSGFYARALVVDDEPISARAAGSALHRAGFNVVTIEDSIAALDRLRKESFDLILLDISMPGLDGLELCKRVRTLPRYQQTPIVFVSGQADLLNWADTLRSGANDVITKPFLPIEMAVKAVTHWLRAKLPAGVVPT